MAALTYPLLTVVDDSGVITSGATVTIASVTDKAGSAIGTPGATVNQAGPNVSVDYDAEAKGDAWITLAISKAATTITGLNAAPAFFVTRDPQRLNIGFNATGQLVASAVDLIVIETNVNLRQAISPILAAVAGTLSGAAPGGGTILINGGNVPTQRISAVTDNNGNRSTVTLSLPA